MKKTYDNTLSLVIAELGGVDERVSMVATEVKSP